MRQWISQQDVAFYVVTAVTIIGVILTAAANRAYKRLMKEADHVEESTNRLIKYIKLKYSSYYKIGLKPNDMRAMVNRYFQKYRLGPVSLQTWSKSGILTAGIAGVIVMVYLLMGFYQGKRFADMYAVVISGILSEFILMVQYMLCAFKDKREAFCWTMYDYLSNFLKNKIENNPAVLSKEEGLSAKEALYQTDRERKGTSQAAATAIGSGKRTAEKMYDSSLSEFEDDEIDAKIVEDILKEFLI